MKKVFLYLIIVLAAVSVFVGCSLVKSGHVKIESLYFQTENGATFTDVDTLYIDHYEVNGTVFRGTPYTIYNLPGDKYYSYTLNACDADGFVVASAEGQWYVIAGSTDSQTATLTVKHQHVFDDSKWVSDQTSHWHATTCGHTLPKDKAEHQFVEDVCSVCGYENHTFSDKWSYNADKHWHAATCGHNVRKDEADHVFDGDSNVCTVCGCTRHEHEFSNDWSSDLHYHWHDATCEHKGKVRSDSGEHSYGSEYYEKAPTCISGGTAAYSCTVCGKTVTYSVPATPEIHDFNENGVCKNCSIHDATGCYVFYDKGEDSGGWRYLEVAPADLKVVNGVPTVDKTAEGYANGADTFVFGYYRTSDNGYNWYINGATKYNAANCTGTAVGTGKSNTQSLVLRMGAATYSDSVGSGKTGNYAAKLCNDLRYTFNGKTFDGWFLPSKDELNEIFRNRDAIDGLYRGMDHMYYWSSTEDETNQMAAWEQPLVGSEFHIGAPRSSLNRIRPIRAF